jgi:hypothetical protein
MAIQLAFCVLLGVRLRRNYELTRESTISIVANAARMVVMLAPSFVDAKIYSIFFLFADLRGLVLAEATGIIRAIFIFISAITMVNFFTLDIGSHTGAPVEAQVLAASIGKCFACRARETIRTITVLVLSLFVGVEPVLLFQRSVRTRPQIACSTIFTVEITVHVLVEFAREASKSWQARTAKGEVVLASTTVCAKIRLYIVFIAYRSRRILAELPLEIGVCEVVEGFDTVASAVHCCAVNAVALTAVQTGKVSAVLELAFTELPTKFSLALAVLVIFLEIGIFPVGVEVRIFRWFSQRTYATVLTVKIAVLSPDKLTGKSSVNTCTYTALGVITLATPIVHTKVRFRVVFEADGSGSKLAVETVVVDANVVCLKTITSVCHQASVLIRTLAAVETGKGTTINRRGLAEFAAKIANAVAVLISLLVGSVHPVSVHVGIFRGFAQYALGAILTVQGTVLVLHKLTRETAVTFRANTALEEVRLALAVVHAEERLVVAFKTDIRGRELTIKSIKIGIIVEGRNTVASSLHKLSILVRTGATIEAKEASTVVGDRLAKLAASTVRTGTVLVVSVVFCVVPVGSKIILARRATQHALPGVAIQSTITIFHVFTREAAKAFRTDASLQVVCLAMPVVHAEVRLVIGDVFKANGSRSELAIASIVVDTVLVGLETIARQDCLSIFNVTVTDSFVEAGKVSANVTGGNLANATSKVIRTVAKLKVVVIIVDQPVRVGGRVGGRIAKRALSLVFAGQGTVLFLCKLAVKTFLTRRADAAVLERLLATTVIYTKVGHVIGLGTNRV